MRSALKVVWDSSVGRLYQRLFLRYFQAILSRLNTLLERAAGSQQELHDHVHGLNESLDNHARSLSESLDDRARGLSESLDERVRGLNESLDNHVQGLNVRLADHIHGLVVRLDELNVRTAELDAQVRELRAQTTMVIASRWDEVALSRRMATLEDRLLGHDESSTTTK